MLSTPCIFAVNHFFLFYLNAHNMLNTYIYHQLPLIFFGVRYAIFRGDHCVTCAKITLQKNVFDKVT